MNLTYAGTGVDYDAMDPFKRLAQLAARETADNITRDFLSFGSFREFEPSRGESAYLIQMPDAFLALVVEGLGTKNLVADAMYELTGKTYYDHIAQCAVAMIVNDMITLGASPLSVAMHLAVGTSAWFNDEARSRDLVKGWKEACNLARCTYGPGETPTLKGVVFPEAIELSGSAIGIVQPKSRLITGRIQDGDAIIMVESSGIHANGLTLARKIAEKLPQGYLTKLSDGRSYGEALLDPTHIYVGLMEDWITAGVGIHYAVNITGHGWRKLMRDVAPFTYVIETLPPQLPIFDFIQEHGPVDDKEAYGNLNMGAGFAIYVHHADVSKALEVSRRLFGLKAIVAGYITEGEKQVLIKPKGLVYTGDTLAVR